MNENYFNPINLNDVAMSIRNSAIENEIKASNPKETGDTYFEISWKDFIEIITKYGFKCAYKKNFMGTNNVEEEAIFFHAGKGLILYASTVNGNLLYNAHVYGVLRLENVRKLTNEQCNALDYCVHNSNGLGYIYFDVDAREGLLYRLKALSGAFSFSRRWNKKPFLFFINYMDKKDQNFNYQEITDRKIDSCTEEVRLIIPRK